MCIEADRRRIAVRQSVRVVDVGAPEKVCRRVFASGARWTVVRGSDLEDGQAQGLPVWSRHVGDPVLEAT
ncbi:hypothetical protein GCM10027570_50960 [Streptomonospora sediminis]